MVHRTDASACVGILKRKGAGLVKHLSVRQLWVQEIMTRPNMHTEKLPRADNPADLLCSLPTGDSLRRHFATMGFVQNPETATHPRGEWMPCEWVAFKRDTDVRRSDGLTLGLDGSDALSTVS